MIRWPMIRKSGLGPSLVAQAPPRARHYIQMYQSKLTNHLDGGHMATESIISITLVLRKRMQQEDDHEVVLAEGGKPPNKNKAD